MLCINSNTIALVEPVSNPQPTWDVVTWTFVESLVRQPIKGVSVIQLPSNNTINSTLKITRSLAQLI